MSKAIPVEELPPDVERLLRSAWERQEEVVLERDGKPVAAVVPMEEYRRLHPEAADTEPPPLPLAYELPPDLLDAYHRLLNKKFSAGLTPEEEKELERVGRELDEADMQMPLEQAIDARARREHARWMSTLDDVIAKLHSLHRT